MRKILLVDDDPLLTRATARILGRAGFEVEVTNRSFGVLNLVSQVRPDVVVLDLHMPGLAGGDLMELLRADPELQQTRVILYSGVGEDELRQRTRETNADGWVTKKDGAKRLVEVVRAA